MPRVACFSTFPASDLAPGFSLYDQWEAQLLAMILLKARVGLYSEIPGEEVRRAHLEPVRSIAARVPRLVGRGLVKLYRYTLSPLVGFHCRYLPTCSDYAHQALASHGLRRGFYLTLRRLLRCRPLGGWGYDPVPAHPAHPAQHP